MESNKIHMEMGDDKRVLGLSLTSRDYTPVKDPYTQHLATLRTELEYLQRRYVDIRKLEKELKTIKDEWTTNKKNLTQLSTYLNNPQNQTLHISVQKIITATVEDLKTRKTNSVYHTNIWSYTAKHRDLKDVLDKVKTNLKKLNKKFPDDEQTNEAGELIHKLEREMKITQRRRKIKEEINAYNAAVEEFSGYWSSNKELFDNWFTDVNKVFNFLQEKYTGSTSYNSRPTPLQ